MHVLRIKYLLSVGVSIILICGETLGQVKPNNGSIQYTATPVLEAAHRSSATINYVRSWVPKKPITSPSTVISEPVADVKYSTAYVDGQGRVMQTVMKQGSPSGKDMISYKQFDQYGRETRQPLAYVSDSSNGAFKINPYKEQEYYYTTPAKNNNQYPGEKVFFGLTEFENSPLGRPTSVRTPGNAWAGNGRGINSSYELNTTIDSVRLWTIGDEFGSSPETSSTYAEAQLTKTVTEDENFNKVIEYKDKQGQVILKKVQIWVSPSKGHAGWLCTYYIYDDYGQLRCVIQPQGVKALNEAGWPNPSPYNAWASVLVEQCFYYEYDHRNRMIQKILPGGTSSVMVYDARDRLVMSQDANLYSASQWLYTQYDGLNRPVLTGQLNDGNGREYHQDQAASVIDYPMPEGEHFILTETYYDNYDWVEPAGDIVARNFISTHTSNTDYFYTASNTTAPFPQNIAAVNTTSGKPTGSKVNILGTEDYLYVVSFYDENGRVIQSHSTNISGGKDTLTMQYSFDSKLLRTLLCHAKAGTNAQNFKLLSKNEYDQVDRLITVKKKLNGSPEVTIFQNSYDELGQLKQKRIGLKRNTSSQNTYTSDVIDSLNYTYNIRGWMKSINKDYTNDTHDNNWFGMEMSYDYGFTENQFNGNISGIRWRSRGDDEQRAFGYSYDAANRFLKADFTQYASLEWTTPANLDFAVRNMSYDANGNIQSMSQKGWKLGGPFIMDSLIYGYGTNSNKLSYVTDKSNDATTKLGDFKEITNNTSTDYGYDANGNMNSDNNKEIIGIEYNHLNLPYNIAVDANSPYTAKTISYLYDALGNKLKKIAYEAQGSGNNKTTTTLYLNGFVYESKSSAGSLLSDNYADQLQHIAHEEGRLRPRTPGLTDTMYYDYFEKDHLGNVRIMLTDELKTDMYPAATMETANATVEEAFYSNLSSTRVDVPSGIGYPPNTPTGNAKVAKVSANTGDQKLGPAILLKVMAGDKFTFSVNSFWNSSNAPGTPVSPLNDILTNIGSSAATMGGTHTSSQIINSDELEVSMEAFLYGHNHGNSGYPQAYVNWVLLNERFELVMSSSGYQQVGNSQACEGFCPPGGYETLSRTNLPVDKSGYLYIFVTNTTPNIPVYFDNLTVTHIRGPLLEESHYYPYGLSITGLGSKTLGFGGVENKRKFNNGSELHSEEFSDISGLEWYSTLFRSLDPQIGRWLQLDPKPDFSQTLYSSMGNNPIIKNDPLGDTTVLTPYGTSFWLPDDAQIETFNSKSTYQIGDNTISGADLGGENGVRAYTYKGNRYVANFDKETMHLSSFNNAKNGRPDLWGTRAALVENAAIRQGAPLKIEDKGSVGLFNYNSDGNLSGQSMMAPMMGGSTNATSFKNITPGRHTPNFEVGMKYSDFRSNMANLAGKQWIPSKDGKVSSIEFNGLRYVGREHSKHGAKTVEIWRGEKLIQKYRLK